MKAIIQGFGQQFMDHVDKVFKSI